MSEIWKAVRELESEQTDRHTQLKQARATMLVNWGREGKTVPGLISENMKLDQMVCEVFQYYHDRLAQAQVENKRLREGLKAVESLMTASEGVYGLHLNGDPSPWSELRTSGAMEPWLMDFDAALEEE